MVRNQNDLEAKHVVLKLKNPKNTVLGSIFRVIFGPILGPVLGGVGFKHYLSKAKKTKCSPKNTVENFKFSMKF